MPWVIESSSAVRASPREALARPELGRIDNCDAAILMPQLYAEAFGARREAASSVQCLLPVR